MHSILGDMCNKARIYDLIEQLDLLSGNFAGVDSHSSVSLRSGSFRARCRLMGMDHTTGSRDVVVGQN